MFLGFDISTSIIGVTCVDKHGEIIFCEHCDLRKHKTLFEKIDVFRKFLADIRYLQTVVREIWIEEPFVFFSSGGSSGIRFYFCHVPLPYNSSYSPGRSVQCDPGAGAGRSGGGFQWLRDPPTGSAPSMTPYSRMRRCLWP